MSFILLASLGLIISGCLKKSAINTNQGANQNQNTSASTTTEEIDTSDWKTYPIGISTYYFKYPSELFVVRKNIFNINLFSYGTNESQIIISLGPGSDVTSRLNEKYANQDAISHCTIKTQTINIDCQQVISTESVIFNGVHGYRVILNKKIKGRDDEITLEKLSIPYYYLDLVSTADHHIVMAVWVNPELFNDKANADESYAKQIINEIVSTIDY